MPPVQTPSEPSTLRFGFGEEFRNNSAIAFRVGAGPGAGYLYGGCKCRTLGDAVKTNKQTCELANKPGGVGDAGRGASPAQGGIS